MGLRVFIEHLQHPCESKLRAHLTHVGTLEIMSYRVPHQPEANGAAGHSVDEIFPGFYERPGVYASLREVPDQESVAVIESMRGDIDAMVTVYRAVPDASFGIEEGNWVTLSESYAKLHAEQFDGVHWPIISTKVRAGDIRSPGDSVNEWGYFPSAYGLPISHELVDQPEPGAGGYSL